MPEEEKTIGKRKAILSAEAKGYRRPMVDDEAVTIATFKKYRRFLSMLIEQHNGRVVDLPGDHVLADFASAVDAVTCAVEIQKVLKEKNDELPDENNLEFRIGVNIGNALPDGDRIYGSGVNVAARIEGLIEPGEVGISQNAYDQIRDKLDIGYEYLGEHRVKNIKQPVRVYKVLMAPEDAGKLVGVKSKSSMIKRIWPLVAATIIVILGIVASVSFILRAVTIFIVISSCTSSKFLKSRS